MSVVSIIVPCYNHAPFLRQRMDSILNQTFQDYEIILLDDASTDESISILKEYQHHEKVSQFVVNKTNSGNPFIQWQKGLSLAKSDYIWIAETDDLAEPTLLSKMYDRLSSSPEAGLIYCQSKTIDNKGQVGNSLRVHTEVLNPELWKNDFQLNGGEAPLNYFFVKNIVPNASAVLFKKSVLQSSNWIPNRFRYAGDWFAWIEITKKHAILFCSEVLNYHRFHANTTRTKSSTLQYVLELYEIRKIINEYVEVMPDIKERTWKVLFKKFVNVARLKNSAFSWSSYRTLFTLSTIDRKILLRLFQYIGTAVWNNSHQQTPYEK